MSKLKSLNFKVTTLDLAKADSIVMSLCKVPRSQIRAMFQHGCVSVNGKPCPKPETRLKIGDSLKLEFDAERKYKEKKKAPPSDIFKVVYEDGHLIVVDKEAGVLSVPTKLERGMEKLYLIMWGIIYRGE